MRQIDNGMSVLEVPYKKSYIIRLDSPVTIFLFCEALLGVV
jgi:hypothetical protein